MKANAYTTMQRARSLRERHPDATQAHVTVALILATFADGPTGTGIRPGLETVAEIAGMGLRTVRRHVQWLEERNELRRDKQGHRGSAACFTWIGGKAATAMAPFVEERRPERRPLDDGKAATAMAAHLSDRSYDQASPDGLAASEGSSRGTGTRKRGEPSLWRVSSSESPDELAANEGTTYRGTGTRSRRRHEGRGSISNQEGTWQRSRTVAAVES